jgi:hypothetical protein
MRATQNFVTAAFFGLISPDPIASIQVFAGESADALPGSHAMVIDNVIAAQAPEPSTCVSVTVRGLALLERQDHGAARRDAQIPRFGPRF